MEWIIIFSVGIAVDFLATFYTRSVANRKILSATLTSFLIDFLSFLVFCAVLEKMSNGDGNAIAKILVYSLGAALGTALVMLDWKMLSKKASKAIIYFLF